MSNTPRFLPRKLSYFLLNYSTGYQTFILHHVVQDTAHPLNIIRKRVISEREKTGLWWHVTVNSNSSKAPVVRSWLRRRLRNAVVEELKDRGITEDGKIIKDAGKVPRSDVLRALLEKGENVSLEGSFRLHALSPLVSAKYVDVRRETGAVIDALVKGLEADLMGKVGNTQGRRHPSVPSQRKRTSIRRLPLEASYLKTTRKRTVAMNT